MAWQEHARCSGAVTEFFYPPRDRSLYGEYSSIAKQYCIGESVGDGEKHCTVIKECLLFALMSEEDHGIWGGLSTRERSSLIRTQRNLPWWITEEELAAVTEYRRENVAEKHSEVIETEEVFGDD